MINILEIVILGPIRSRQNKSVVLRKNAMEYLNTRSDRENEIRMKELEFDDRRLTLEERKILLAEKKLEMEVDEHKKRMEMEYEKFKLEISERNVTIELISFQQKIMDSLLKRLQKYEAN